MSPGARVLAVFALTAFAGCGFSPLYGGGGGADGGTAPVADRLAQVDVLNIPERPGQLLRLSLQDQLYAGAQPTVERYSLAVSYTIANQGIGVQSDTSVTRNRFIAIANWTLAPIGAPTAPLAAGTATTENAANVIDQQYFALTLETDTINRQLADQIAQQIATQLGAWFKSHPAS